MGTQQQIESKLQQGLSPVRLDVVNESHMHSVPANSETHFKVVVVSAAFEGLSPLKRHQQVYRLLADELAAGVHALALHTYTEAEWADTGSSPDSPNCKGGSKTD